MVKFKAAEQSDISAIAKLEKKLFSDAWSESMLSDCLLQKHYVLMVCVSSSEGAPDTETTTDFDNVIGYLISTHVAGEAELLRIGVAPEERRKGLGRGLMKAFVELCAGRETPDAFLEVRAGNVPAISLYEQFGFRAVGTRKKYYHHPEEDACLMAGTVQDYPV